MPYLTPDEIPEGTACRPLYIPDSTAWLALVSGILTEGTKFWNWQKFGALTVQECVDVMQGIVDAYYAGNCYECTLPDGEAVERLNEAGEVEQLIDGEWQEPQGSYAIPSPEAREEPTPEERRCAAAANAANVLKLMYEEVTDAYQNNLSEAFAIVQLATAVIALIAPPVGLTLSALAKIALAAWASAYAAAEFVTSDFWNSDFDDNIKCAFLRCASDNAGVVTFDFQCVQGELLNQIEWIDPTLGSFALAGQVRWLLTQIGAQGLNLAGTTTAITDADCSECIEPWCRREQFSLSDWGYTATNDPAWGGLLADYSPPWTEVANRTRAGVGDNATFLQIGKYLPPASYTKIEVDVTISFGYSSVGTLSFGATQIGGGSASVTTDGIHTLVIEGAWGGDDGFNIGAPIAYSGAGGVFPVGGNAEVTEVRYYGVGTPPDLGVEC